MFHGKIIVAQKRVGSLAHAKSRVEFEKRIYHQNNGMCANTLYQSQYLPKKLAGWG